ncbi:MAG TPA: hypothetical protein VMI73_02015 [Trebonia sp.]|nr:hypothetical protein [Trebonia sp.]
MPDPLAENVAYSPATMQYVAALHDTSPSTVWPAPLGVLTGTAFQVPACHRAATGVEPAEESRLRRPAHRGAGQVPLVKVEHPTG